MDFIEYSCKNNFTWIHDRIWYFSENLQGVNDWRDTSDIVRITLKTLTDVVKNQGEVIRELERQNISNVSANMQGK